MRADKLEIRTRALRAGETVAGKWQPGGQVIGTLYVVEPGLALHIAERLMSGRQDGEEWEVRVCGRCEVPTD